MKRHDTTWERLAAAARKSPPPEGNDEAPHGFAARVAARAFAEPDPSELWLRYGWRALAAALAALAAVAVCAAIGFSRPAQDWADGWLMAPLSEQQNDRSL